MFQFKNTFRPVRSEPFPTKRVLLTLNYHQSYIMPHSSGPLSRRNEQFKRRVFNWRDDSRPVMSSPIGIWMYEWDVCYKIDIKIWSLQNFSIKNFHSLIYFRVYSTTHFRHPISKIDNFASCITIFRQVIHPESINELKPHRLLTTSKNHPPTNSQGPVTPQRPCRRGGGLKSHQHRSVSKRNAG